MECMGLRTFRQDPSVAAILGGAESSCHDTEPMEARLNGDDM